MNILNVDGGQIVDVSRAWYSEEDICITSQDEANARSLDKQFLKMEKKIL